jgi:tetratricopeptide (TPR) repeat protein
MTARRLAPVAVLILILVLIPASIQTVRWSRQSSPQEDVDPEYERFMQMAHENKRAEALELGDSLFKALLEEKPENPALVLLAKRLSVAEQIRALVTTGVRPSQRELLEGIPGMADLGLPPPASADRAAPASFLPPARKVYWTRVEAFTDKPVSEGLSTPQTAFCDRYYDLRMQDLIMEVGRQVVMTDPNCSENVCHALVLPLLHLHGRDDDWEQMEPLLALFSPEMLDVLSRFVLLQIERCQAATAVAAYRARAMNKRFSPARWALDAADACVADRRPDLAEQLLRMVAATAGDRDSVAQLQLRAAESYARCGDQDTAAQICERILADLPDISFYGRIKAMRLGYLAREDRVEQVIVETRSALQDPRCESYVAQVLYLRWWALRKTDRLEEAAQIAQRLLEQYPDSPCAAPVLLERATDALAHQEYDRCRELLTRLARDFAGSESAARARDILARLEAGAVSKGTNDPS